MDAWEWQRHVAVACSEAWKLDAGATREVLECIETIIAATPVAGSGVVRVFLGTGVGELTVEMSGERIRVSIQK